MYLIHQRSETNENFYFSIGSGAKSQGQWVRGPRVGRPGATKRASKARIDPGKRGIERADGRTKRRSEFLGAYGKRHVERSSTKEAPQTIYRNRACGRYQLNSNLNSYQLWLIQEKGGREEKDFPLVVVVVVASVLRNG